MSTINTKNVITIKNLNKSFANKHIIKDLSLDIKYEESFVLLGGSGSGKSVLLRCVLGLLEADSGCVEIDNTHIIGKSFRALNKVMANIGMMFQGGALFDSLTVWENITFRLQNDGMSVNQAKEVAKEKIQLVDLPLSCLKDYPASLSGGMAKRVALARAIAHNPKILFFDEPTTGLDPITGNLISELIRDVVTQINASALTITHDMNCMKVIGDKVGLLNEGTIHWHGNKEDFLVSNDKIIKQFFQYS